MSARRTNGREVEGKLAARDAVAARRLLAALGVDERVPAASVPVRDVYYDTRERRLLGAGYAFRVRTLPEGVFEATLKSVEPPGPEGIADREEHTVRVGGPRPRLDGLPAGPLRSALQALAGPSPLVALARVSGTRRSWRVRAGRGLQVEVAHDRVRLLAGGVSRSEHEVEAELAAGAPSAFAAWFRRARRRAHARPSRGSKLERALRAGRVPLPPPSRVAAARLALRPAAAADAPATEALAQGLAHLSTALAAALEAARRGGVEGVHDVRTVSRRLRALAAAHRDEIPGRARRDLRRHVDALRRAAGPVRDLDVARGLLARARLAPDQAAGLACLRSALAARRARARASLANALASPRLARAPQRVADLACQVLGGAAPPFAVAGAARLPSALELPLAHRARLGAALATAPTEALHALRIAAKRARYAAEAFAPAFGRPVARFAAAARALQDALGTVQDARAVGALLQEVAAAAARSDPAALPAPAAAAAATAALERRAQEARTRLSTLYDAAFSPRALRTLLGHLGRRAASVARG